jgi:hypothetical protein
VQSEKSRTTWRGRGLRGAEYAAGGGAIALAIIMALSPAALAGTVVPPYAGTHSTTFSDLYSICGTASGKAAKWAPHTGLITGSAKASANGNTCPAYISYADDFTEKWTYISIPFSASQASPYNATLTLTYRINDAMAAAGPTGCPAATNYSSGYDYLDCAVYVSWELYTTVYLWDMTNSSEVSESYSSWSVGNYSETYDDSSCYYGTCATYSNSYVGSSAGDYGYQAPGYDFSTAYLGNGVNAGSFGIWSNTSNWNPTSMSGDNMTLNPHHGYVVVLATEYFADSEVYGSSYGYTGTSSFYDYFPVSGSGSASVVGTGTGFGEKLTSVTATAV